MSPKKAFIAAVAALSALLVLAVAALFVMQREDRVRLLFAVSGDGYDRAAYDNFQQTLAANVTVSKLPLNGLTADELSRYDAVYLDYTLKHTETVRQAQSALTAYVKQGGHLFLENDFAADFPAGFLGASEVADLPLPADLKFEYPPVGTNLQGLQTTFKLFVDSYASQNVLTDGAQGASSSSNALPGYAWGKGLTPTTAQPIVVLNGFTVMAANRYGQGSVVLSSGLLPSHYFITGFDLESGMDPEKGFNTLVQRSADAYKPAPGSRYFHFKYEQPIQPHFQFAFAAANYQLRNQFLAYVSKEKLGYSVTKVLGPYGRPAMAYQNHFEVAEAVKNEDGIRWAELLREYNQIPTFSLVRSAYDWATWYEDVTVHLNLGTQEAPVFVGELTNSFYGSGARLSMENGRPITLTPYPAGQKGLSDTIGDPFRAYPAAADLNGDGRTDLIAGSQDGSLRVYKSVGPRAEAYAGQPLPSGADAPDAYSAAGALAAADGTPLRVAGYAAPAVGDVDGDGRPDLVAGDKDGRLWLARGVSAVRANEGGATGATQAAGGSESAGGAASVGGGPGALAFGAFAPGPSPGVAAAAGGYAAPCLADYDGDGTVDAVVGTGDGSVYGYRGNPGTRGGFEAGRLLVLHPARFAAPSVRDMNADGKPDLAVGSEDGDIVVYLRNDDGTYASHGPLTGATANQTGSRALVGGHHSVPLWLDVNHDGRDDLVVGQLEFALPVPMDDPAFPFGKQLQNFVNYAKRNALSIQPHLFFHSYLSNEQEQQEIALHRRMFETLGLPWPASGGTNQHTWRINNTDRLQTLRNENSAGLWFNFGFRPPDNPQDPQYGQDYVWGLPFLLQADGLKSPMLLHTPAYIYRPEGANYASQVIYDAYAQLDMPIDYFDHIENKVAEPEGVLTYVRMLDGLRNTYDYNFMTEDQMARSFLTTLTAKVDVRQSYGSYWLNRLKDRLGRGKHLSVTLSADRSGVPAALAEAYGDTLGVAIEPGARYAGAPLAVDSEIYTARGTTLYTGLTKPVEMGIRWNAKPAFHLIRSNVPYELTRSGSTATIRWLADGMQQVKLYSPTPLTFTKVDQNVAAASASTDVNTGSPSTDSKVLPGDTSMNVKYNEQDGTYTVTHYGPSTSILIKGLK